jgi:hypothetical protein
VAVLVAGVVVMTLVAPTVAVLARVGKEITVGKVNHLTLVLAEAAVLARLATHPEAVAVALEVVVLHGLTAQLTLEVGVALLTVVVAVAALGAVAPVLVVTQHPLLLLEQQTLAVAVADAAVLRLETILEPGVAGL